MTIIFLFNLPTVRALQALHVCALSVEDTVCLCQISVLVELANHFFPIFIFFWRGGWFLFFFKHSFTSSLETVIVFCVTLWFPPLIWISGCFRICWFYICLELIHNCQKSQWCCLIMWLCALFNHMSAESCLDTPLSFTYFKIRALTHLRLMQICKVNILEWIVVVLSLYLRSFSSSSELPHCIKYSGWITMQGWTSDNSQIVNSSGLLRQFLSQQLPW